MIINELIKKKKILIVFFFIYVIGLLIFKDYGLTLDDEHYRINGVYYKNFIKQYLNLLVSFNFTDLKLLGKEIETGSLKNHPVIFETILAGEPKAIEKASISFVTTDPAPITEHSCIVTPGKIITPAPIHTSFFKMTFFETKGYILINLELFGDESVIIVTLGPIETLSPKLTVFFLEPISEISKHLGI